MVQEIQVRQTILVDFLGGLMAAILALAGQGSENPKYVFIGQHPQSTAGKYAQDDHKVIRLLKKWEISENIRRYKNNKQKENEKVRA